MLAVPTFDLGEGEVDMTACAISHAAPRPTASGVGTVLDLRRSVC